MPLRLALARINPTVGDIPGNQRLIIDAIARAKALGANLVVLPELALCGYPPRDLLLREGFVAACASAAKSIGELHTAGITAIFGSPLPAHEHSKQAPGPVANSLLAYADNRLLDSYDKRLLPTYDVFDEDRYFEPGSRSVVVNVGEHRVGLAICEDLWKGEDAGFSSRYAQSPDPVAQLVQHGATLIVSPSASPFVLGKSARHRAIVASHARKHIVWVASLNQLGGNDDLVFDGHAMLFAPGGSLHAKAPVFNDDLLIVDVPASNPHDASPKFAAPELNHAPPGEESDELRLLYQALVLGVRDYLRKTGFKAAILGLSGGIDSALTAVLAAAAVGPANITGVALPSRYSSQGSITDAYDLAKRLGMPCVTIPIEAGFESLASTINTSFQAQGLKPLGASLPDLTEENLQSRIRGTILMAISNRSGAIVLTTGNKSELAVGYCTLYGDMNGGLAVLSDVSKQVVYALSRWINQHHASLGFTTPPIPEPSITKAPSAELRPNQTDQDSLPPYDVLDAIIERAVERQQSIETVHRDTKFERATIERVFRLIDLSEYKRRQAAIGLKVTSIAFGPGRRQPIVHRWRNGAGS